MSFRTRGVTLGPFPRGKMLPTVCTPFSAIIHENHACSAFHRERCEFSDLYFLASTFAYASVSCDETTRAALSNLALADLATAQGVRGRVGRLSRIEVGSEEDGSPRLAALRSALPPAAVLSRTASRSESLAKMTAAFRLNLRALSLLALLCGALLIYNTMSFSVVERRALFGLLRR